MSQTMISPSTMNRSFTVPVFMSRNIMDPRNLAPNLYQGTTPPPAETVASNKYKAQTKLYPFQRESVERAKKLNGGRCFLAHEQGLGKTLMAITFTIETDSFPAVVVCPGTLKSVWAREFQRHYGKEVTVLNGRRPPQAPLPKDGDRVYVLNYDIVCAWKEKLLELEPKVLILDECQKVKRHTTKWTKVCAELADASERFLALSGTPMTNNPADLYPTLSMIAKGHIISRWNYMCRYTRWYTDRYGNERVTGTKNEEELHRALRDYYMIRYKIDDVIKDLPPYVRQTTFIEMTGEQRAEYLKMKADFLRWLAEHYPDRRIPRCDIALVLSRLSAMRMRVAEWKVPFIKETLDNFLDSNEGKIIVFALHHKLLDPLTDCFKNSGKPNKPLLVRLDGKTPQKKRAEAVDAFQNGPARVFLGQMNTAGLGLTLTAARHSLFAELDYLPTSHLQAESRTRRIGSEGSYIQYNYLVMKDTLDEAVAQRLFARQKAINQVIDGSSEEDDAKMDDFNVLGGVLADDFGFSLV